MKTLPKGWSLAVNSKTGKYAPRTRSGIVIQALAIGAARGGTIQQAIDCSWRIVRGIKATEREDKEWVNA